MTRPHVARAGLQARCRGLVVMCCLMWPAVAIAQSPIRGLSADRYDVSLALLPDGSIDVRETIVFQFRERTFSEVEREISFRRLDGIIDVRASMDGRTLEEGGAEGQVRIRRGRRALRVTWRFSDTANQARTFTLEYRVMGILAVANGRATLAWTVLPARHRYPIAEARVEWRVPAAVVRVEPTALDDPRWTSAAMTDGWAASRTGVALDETVTLTDAFDLATLAVAQPAWQTNQDRAQQMTPAFVIGAITLLVMGLGVVGMTRFRYYVPRVDLATVTPAAPGSLPPAVGTALVKPWVVVGVAQAQATLLDLARRGIVTIREAGGAYELVMPAPHGLRPHEQVLADALWPHLKHGVIDLKTAWKHLQRALPAFRRGVLLELRDRGLLDPERQAAGRGLKVAGLVVTTLGIAGLVIFANAFGHLGDIPLLVPGAVLVSGIIFLIVGQTMSVLSASGVVVAAAWRARQRELKRAVHGGFNEDLDRWLPAGAGFGLAPAMLKAGKASGHAGAHAIVWLKSRRGI